MISYGAGLALSSLSGPWLLDHSRRRELPVLRRKPYLLAGTRTHTPSAWTTIKTRPSSMKQRSIFLTDAHPKAVRKERAPEIPVNLPKNSHKKPFRRTGAPAPPSSHSNRGPIAVRLSHGFPQTGRKDDSAQVRFRNSLNIRRKSETHKARQQPS